MDIRRGSHFPSLCGARILIYGLLVIDRSVHIFQSCGFDQFDNACCPSLEWSLSLGNSLCISPRGLLQSDLYWLACMPMPAPRSFVSITGKPDFTCSPNHNHTTFNQHFLPHHLPHPHHQSYTTTISPICARKILQHRLSRTQKEGPSMVPASATQTS